MDQYILLSGVFEQLDHFYSSLSLRVKSAQYFSVYTQEKEPISKQVMFK